MWISEAMWRLVDERVSARRDPAKDQALIWRLVCAIAASLKGDRRRRAEEAGKEVDMLLGSDPSLQWEAWHRLKGWYWAVFDRALSPAWVTLERIMAERVDLYSYVPPLGKNIPIYVETLPLDDSVPMEDKIEWMAKRLKNHRSGGPSGMRDEHLKGWLAAKKKKEREEAAAGKEHPTEEKTTEGPVGTGGEETVDRRGGKPTEASN